jgi:hypothetical protein
MSETLSIIIPKSYAHDITEIFNANGINYDRFASKWDEELTKVVTRSTNTIDTSIQKATAIIAISLWIQETKLVNIPVSSSNTTSNKVRTHKSLQAIVESINTSIVKLKNANKWEWITECNNDPLITKIDTNKKRVHIDHTVLNRILFDIVKEKRKIYDGVVKVLEDPPKDPLPFVRELAAATADKKPPQRGGSMKGGVSHDTENLALAFAGLNGTHTHRGGQRTRKNKKIY